MAVSAAESSLASHWREEPTYRSAVGPEVSQCKHLTTAVAMYREMGMDFWLEKAEAALKGIG